jgi:hypothetical protein
MTKRQRYGTSGIINKLAGYDLVQQAFLCHRGRVGDVKKFNYSYIYIAVSTVANNTLYSRVQTTRTCPLLCARHRGCTR